MDNHLQQGQLKRWNDDKGYGFIKTEGHPKDIFLHISALKGNGRRPKEGDIILYRIYTENEDKKGSKLLDLEVFKINNQAKKFYEKHGFIVISETESSYVMAIKG